MSQDITEMIDDICKSQYGHTNWGFADMLTEEQLKEIKDKKLGDKMPSIIFYYDEVEDPYKFVVYKKCDKGWKKDMIFKDEDDAIDYVDKHKNEYGICSGIHYKYEELTEEEVKNYDR
tara:strand:- start:35 stop:388 length:354 start_codon:yes stop_codon:yes gene_type:complete